MTEEPTTVETEDAPGSMPTAEAVAAGSADPGETTVFWVDEQGVSVLAPAPMPQFEMARAGGVEDPVYPEGLEELLARGGRALPEQNSVPAGPDEEAATEEQAAADSGTP